MDRIALALRGKATDAYEATDAEEHQTDTFLGQGVALVCALDFRPLGVSTVSVRHLVGAWQSRRQKRTSARNRRPEAGHCARTAVLLTGCCLLHKAVTSSRHHLIVLRRSTIPRRSIRSPMVPSRAGIRRSCRESNNQVMLISGLERGLAIYGDAEYRRGARDL